MKSFLWRHKYLLAIWAVVFGIAGYVGYTLFFKTSGHENPYVLSNTSSQSNSSKPAETEPKLQQITMNQTARDGGFEFKVTGVRCSEQTIGSNQYAFAEAEGTFCRVSVEIKNTGDSPASLPLQSQFINTDSDDVKHPADKEDTQYAQEDQTAGYWYEDIAPEETVSGDIVFDPPSPNVSRVILHGSENTPGIEVEL
jgi:hypothetical protein